MFVLLQEMTEKTASQLPLVEVHTAEENELVLEIEPFQPEGKSAGNDDAAAVPEPKSSEGPVQSTTPAQDTTPEKGRRNAVRQLSECSSDDRVGSPAFFCSCNYSNCWKKGILNPCSFCLIAEW